MPGENYPRGSEWRKWDLHLHSPITALNNGFTGSSVEEKWDKFVAKLETQKDTAVFGITDYFSIDGYLKLVEYKTAGRLENIDLILPNIEFRIIPVTAAEKPINIHLILSPAIVPEVEARLFQSLEFPYNGSTYKCTRNDLIKLGKAYNAAKTGLTEQQIYEDGVNQFKISLADLVKVFKNNPDFSKQCIMAVSNSSNDGNSGIQEDNMSATRQEIYRFAKIIFSGNPKDVAYFLGKGVDSADVVTGKYGGLKPCVIGSDAHKLDDIGISLLGRYTWIKANPTFEGLKQIVNEPSTRVFIGEEPPSLLQQKQNTTKIIKQVGIRICAASQLKN